MGLMQLKQLLRTMEKEAGFVPMPGGAPPMDPAMMGGMPPMAPPPMDPAMMGGMPPMDPNMMPPMDPGMMPPPPPEGEGGVDPMLLEAIRQVVREEVSSAGPAGADGKDGGDTEARISRLEDPIAPMIEQLSGGGEMAADTSMGGAPMMDPGMPEGMPAGLEGIPPEALAGMLSGEGQMAPGPMEVTAQVHKDLDNIVNMIKRM